MRLTPLAVAPLLLLTVAERAAAQQIRQVSGTVTSAVTGAPLEDITIGVIGGAAVARTNDKGQYRITVPASEVTLVARGIGYRRITQRVPVSVTTADFKLEKDILQLEQVVITGTTTTLTTTNATTATSVVSNADVTRAPAQSLEQALQGKVLGAKIDMNSGAPGGGAQIQIRGVTSVIGNGQPLIVLDGVIMSNDAFSSGSNAIQGATSASALASNQDAVVNRLADLNPNEIESIEVLKAAAATALYGSRATNGVVVIKTKRGTGNQTRFNLSQRVGTQDALRYLGHRTFSSVADVKNLPYGNGDNPAAAAYLAKAFPSGQIPASANYDLERKFYDNRSPSYNTTASLTAGNEKTQLFASATNNREQGLAPRTGAQLSAGRFNVDQTFSSRLKASMGMNVTRNVLNRGLSNNDNSGTSPIYNFGYTPWVIDLSQRDASGAFPENPFNGGGQSWSNPFQTFNYITLRETVWRATGGGTVTYALWEAERQKISLQGQAGFDRFQQAGDLYSPGFLQYEGGLDNFVGRAQTTNVNSQNYNYNANVTHSWNPGTWASFTTAIGASYEQQWFDLTRYLSRGLLPGVANPGVAGAQNLVSEGNRNLFRDQALFVTEQILALSERLALTGGVRADRSSANGDRDKWYAWPRAAASYRLETPFVPYMDNVKFRASWGTTGNRPRFTDRFVVFGTGSLIGGSSSLIRPGTVNNPDIKPEKLTETEVGGDFSFARQRATLEATYYRRRLTDQLFTAPVAPSTGFNQAIINAGRLENQGVELGLSALPIQRKDLNWTSRVNWTRNRQTVDQLPGSIPRFNVPGSFGAAYTRNAIVSGMLTTAVYGNAPWNFTTVNGVRVPTTLKEPYYFTKNPNAVRNTDYIVVDTIIGNSNPRFLMNFMNTVNWRRFTVALTVDWRNGGDVANMTNNLFDEGGNSRDYDKPSPVAGKTLGQYRYDSWNGGNDARVYLQSGTNVRIRDLQLSFDAPKRYAEALRGRTLRLSLQGRNLWMKTDYWGYDPEFNNFGNTNLNRFIDLAPYPGVRTYSLSVDVGF